MATKVRALRRAPRRILVSTNCVCSLPRGCDERVNCPLAQRTSPLLILPVGEASGFSLVTASWQGRQVTVDWLVAQDGTARSVWPLPVAGAPYCRVPLRAARAVWRGAAQGSQGGFPGVSSTRTSGDPATMAPITDGILAHHSCLSQNRFSRKKSDPPPNSFRGRGWQR